jgi:hypothetical protein
VTIKFRYDGTSNQSGVVSSSFGITKLCHEVRNHKPVAGQIVPGPLDRRIQAGQSAYIVAKCNPPCRN